MRLPSCLAPLLALMPIAALAMAPERALDKEVLVAAPLAQVWAAWTTREGITSFFAPEAEIDARVGGAFHIFMDPLAGPGDRGADDMRYMALQPMRMLSFDWNAPPSLPEARQQRTFVVLRFEPVTEQSTRVHLHHSGWGDGGEWDKAYSYFDHAWGKILGNLQERFVSGPHDWREWMQQLREAHAAEAAKPAR